MKTIAIKVTLVCLFFGMISCSETIQKATPNNNETKSSSIHEISAMPQSTTEGDKPIFHKSHEPKKQAAPFSDAVQVGNTFYLSGQIGMNHTTRELVEGGIEAETKQTLENIRDVLSQHGMSLQHIVKVTVIIDDIDDFDAFNKIYSLYLTQKPARTTFAAEALARGAKIEIEVIAIKTDNSIIIHG